MSHILTNESQDPTGIPVCPDTLTTDNYSDEQGSEGEPSSDNHTAMLVVRLVNISNGGIEACSLDTVTGKLTATADTAGPWYVEIGKGKNIVIATSVSDAVPLYELSLFKHIIAPLHPEDLIELCDNSNFDSTLKLLILGSRNHSALISVVKRQLNCRSDYPPQAYSSWAEFIDKDGTTAVTEYLRRSNSAASAIGNFVVEDKHVKTIESGTFIFDNLIINQHIVVLCAEPNAGKTTIMNWVCGQISEVNNVAYVNMDCSGADLKQYQEFARDNGFKLINFDITATEDSEFFEALQACDNLKNQVFVIDTLKKCVDLMGKSTTKTFMKQLRALCVKGATFVLLAHTNKHKDKTTGLPIFEGVGDVRSDCDELIYLIPQHDPSGSIIVTTVLDKTRGVFEPITFAMEPDRSVSLTDYIDLIAINKRKADEPAISAIIKALAAGLTIQKDIVEACQAEGVGKRTSMGALELYSRSQDNLWSRAKGDNNAWIYTSTSSVA